MEVLMDVLIMNPSAIVHLNLGANDLHDEGAVEVARLLKFNRSLKKV
jgi:hypothetical protein